MRPTRTFRLVAAPAAVLAAFLLGRHVFSHAPPPDPPPLVSVVVARPRPMEARLALTGTITARAEVALSPEASGVIASVSANIGDHVHKGEVLASLDTAQLQASVAGAKARVAAAAANAAAASRAYGRVAGIAGTGAMAPEEIDQRGADAAAQAAQIDVAKADLAEADAQLQMASITAPMDGVIAARDAQPGAFVAPGGPPLFTLIGDQGLVFQANVPQNQTALLKPGQTATLQTSAGTVTGKVEGVDPAIDPATHLGIVRIALPADAGLVPGSFAEASIDLGQSDALTVPRTALIVGESGFHVMAVQGGRAVSLPVTLSRDLGNSSASVPIGSGIAAGDVIIAQAGASLHDGEAVRAAP